MNIHETALVHSDAGLAKNVEVGPFCSIGPNVRIAEGCRLLSHVVIEGYTDVAEGCVFHPFGTVGTMPQDLKFRGEETRLSIGKDNVFREYVNVNVGTAAGGGLTSIKDSNFFMAYAHVAHDCHIGSNSIFANAATLGGHVIVHDHATVGAFSGVHQFCRIGEYAFVGGYTVVTKDALPFMKTVGNRARVFGINTIGLQRRNFTALAVEQLQQAYRILFQSKLNTTQAIERLTSELAGSVEVKQLIEFISSSQRGVVKR